MNPLLDSGSEEQPGDLRARELRSALAILGELRPAVVLVCGQPGMGKTSLLRALRLRALVQGWRVAADFAGDVPAIHPHTRERRYRAGVLAAVAGSASDDRERTRRSAAVANHPVPERRLDTFVEDLARHAPLLLLVDDYRPSETFAQWFEGVFLPQVPTCGAPVVVAIGHRTGRGALADLVTDAIELEDLDPEYVRTVLAELAPRLDPPMEEDELALYAKEARTPLVLGSLIRVLTYAAAAREGPA